MSERALSFGRAFRAQLLLALDHGWRGRAIGFGLVLLQLVALVAFGVVLGVSINSEGVSFAQVVDFADVFEVPINQVTAALVVCLGTLAIVAWFGPFKLWEGEPPSQRDYHWSMPVAKDAHDLARVLAGVIIYFGWALALYGSVVLLALFSGKLTLFAGLGLEVWLCLLLGPLLWYLLTSFFTVRCEHPTGWIWSIIGVTAAITTLSSLLPLGPLVSVLEVVLFERWGLFTGVAGPVVRELLGFDAGSSSAWPVTWLAWIVILSAAIVWGARNRRRIP